jgi:hypothetical protein
MNYNIKITYGTFRDNFSLMYDLYKLYQYTKFCEILTRFHKCSSTLIAAVH